ncbi:Non-ribosomal peptide synthetase [Coniochaeta hoffmannii]|uniref:Non-ribosomal peptide synthetase n=1 Tax=Coniochaeta hoffmannii TaxID=91930 RepID=A0AA38RG79_9PEZI|nr:Non-ribosomal peptide synthetase [Coniochaeta hoffmannii]
MDIDACELTPSVAGSLLRKRENAPCLRLLLTIGEMLTKPVVDEFGGGDGRPSMLWAMYGPTEAAIHCTLQPALARDASVGNIGFPLDTVSAFILKVVEDADVDKTPRVLPVGEVGELAVGGYQLASGYINRPETTASAFVNSPYGLLYRTLDKARMLPNGTIECLGRIGGGQVKLRGQRIELGEIEQVALRTPGCHGAIADVISGILVLFCAVDVLDGMDSGIRRMYLLGRIQAQNRSALPHASLSLSEIKKAAGLAPGQSLYDVLFVYQESLYSKRTEDDCIREVAHFDYLETKLLVEVEPGQETYGCRLTYHTDAFSDAHIEVLFDEFQYVVQYMLANLDSELTSVRAIFPDQLLSTYNLEPQSFTGIPDLAFAVEKVVSETPDKAALCFARRIIEGSVEADYMSYGEFNSMANRIARHIRSWGCSTGDVVSIVMEKSILLYAGILGIVKAGCSYLPLLPSTPMARMEVIHAQAEVKLCLADNLACANLLDLQGLAVVNLEQTELKDTDGANLNIPADPARVAVIVYTSGSTGVPKGVCVTQLNVTSNIDVLSRIYPTRADSRLLQSCSQAFDVSVFEMFFAWTQGMTLCSATNDTLFEDLECAIRALGATHLSMTPTVASLIDPQKVPAVEFLVTSGEPMTEKVARSWWRQLYQGYGPSETTNICTVKKMGPDDAIRHLGYSFANTSTVVLYQDGLDVVPRGCLGELCFGGDQVAQGYLNLVELTATKFIDHPEYGRRVDDQIKLRGQRIELNEINTAVRDSNMVSDCFTMLVNRDNPSAMQLASFYVPQDSAGAAQAAVLPLDDRIKDFDTWEPPLSFAVIRQGKQVHLSFVCHHALYDGIAIALLLYEVEQLAKGVPLPPPPLVEPFLRAMLADSSTSDSFWRRQLLDFRPVELPASSSPPAASKTHDVHSTQIHIPLSDISERTKSIGCSLLSVCQSAWTLVLKTLLGVDDVCFGNVVSCRSVDVDGIENLAAPCFNTVPVRANLSNIRQNIDLIKTLNVLNPEIIQHQFTSLRRIQSVAFPDRIQRLFDTLLILQQPARSLDHKLWSLERDDGEMDIPLVCEFRPDTQHDILSVQLHCECSRISKPFIEAISELLQHCMSVCLNYPLSQIPTPSTLPASVASMLSELDLQQKSPVITEIESGQDGERWSATETRIRAVLAKLSSVPEQNIRRTTTIYQLGLDSINAVQIASLLRKQGLVLSASHVIEHKTCANLAKRALGHADHASQSPLYDFAGYRRRAESQLAQLDQHDIHKESINTILPCTSLQAGMIVQFIYSKGRDYFNFVDYQVDAAIKLSDLGNAWSEIALSHAILRIGFVPVDDAEHPFAMVEYNQSVQHETVRLVENDTWPPWSVEDWRQDMADDVLRYLELPPWRVACVHHGGGGPTMHLAIHHALYDAHSLQVIMEDFARLLSGESPSPHPATQEAVKDIILQGSQVDKQEAFWKAQSEHLVINTFPTLTPLRVDARKAVVQSMTSGHNFGEIEKSLVSSGFTVQAALQAAWTRILSSYLGETSVTFGVVLSGRNSEATEDAIFPCISTVPLISSNKHSNRELLQSMLEYSGHMYRNQHVPLNKIQRWLGYPEGKIFDTLLVYQKMASSPRDSLPWKVLDDRGTVDYPVSIEVKPSPHDTLVYRITTFSDIVPEKHARLLLQQFDAVFYDLALRPDGHEDDLFSSAPDLFAVTPAEEPVVRCKERFLHQFVESQALKTPDKVALEFATGFRGNRSISETWSYRSLDDNGNRVAQLLQPHVKTGQIVAVLFDKCPEAFFSILGVLKAGCAFVALDPGAPSPRKQFILEDSGAAVLLTSKDLGEIVDFATNIPLIVIDEAYLQNIDGGPAVLSPELTPQHTCYCLYTSGTTGTPKGCEITHENAVQAMMAFQRLFAGHWDDTSKWLQFASFHFDVSVLEQYWTWSVGITLTAAPRDLILEDLAGTISRLEITHIDLTPSLARLIHPDEVPSLTKGVFITGGEQLKQEILDAWGSKGVIYNAYGPTEATIGVTTYSRVPQNGRPSNIGKQFVNVGTYVLKPGTETPVLRGGVGELCVSGKLVGKGYLGRDDLTRERFPTLKSFNERVYLTGDLVRILHDGCFDFLGRADDQVKLRGQRLELGEINHTIRSGVPDVADVATLVVRNEKQRKDLLVSFVGTGKYDSQAQALHVLSGPDTSDLSQRVQAACRDRLPGYMVPTYVLLLPFIPLSSNNKAETRKLRHLFVDLEQNKLMSLTKPTETAIGLDEAGQDLLRVLSSVAATPLQDVVPNQTIFDYGIDSISVMRFCTALKRAGFTQASPSLVLSNPRLGDLAFQLSHQRTSTEKGQALAARQLVQACHHKYMALVEKELGIAATEIEYIAPCSPLQEGMISRSNMPVSKGSYFNTFKYNLSSRVSNSQLRTAWTKLVDSCSVLRTRFLSTPEGYIQVAVKTTNIPWTELCLATEGHLEDLIKEKHQLWIESNVHHVKQPLEVMVVSIGADTRYMVVNISHGIYDAISLDSMLDRLRQYCLGVSVSTSAPNYLEALVHGPLRNYTGSKDFWVDHLKSASHQSFPIICAQPSHESISCTRLVSVGDLESLRTSLGVTHQAILQAVWISVHQQFLADITIGVVISGRSIDLEGADSVIGPLFNTIAFHGSLVPSETWASLIRKCHAFNVSIIPFQHVALRDVQKWCSGARPLFDTLFSFQRAADKPAVGDELWTLCESPPNPDYALAFEATLTSTSRLRLQLVAKAGIADMDSLSKLLDQVEVALHSVLTPELPIPLASHHLPKAAVNGAGHDELAVQKLDSFEWTTTALAIRDEIACLADVSAESVTATASLLELGLDSIDLIKLSSRLRRRGIVISGGQLMRERTISAIVAHLQREVPDAAVTGNGTASIRSNSEALRDYLLGVGYDFEDVEDILPVTPLQDSMVAEMMQSDFHLYFNHDVLEIDGAIDTDRLLAAWRQVVANSAILRTTFVELDSPDFDAAYCQVIHRSLSPVTQEIAVTDESEFPQVMESARQRASAAGGRAELLQLTLVSVGACRFLVLSIAHALYDGWSLGLIHQDVRDAYQGSYAPRASYKEYLTRIVTASTSEGKQFWSGYLAGAHPTLMSRVKHISADSKEEVHRIDTASSLPTPTIKDFCKRHGVSLQVLGQACWVAVLASRTKSLDVTFGVVLSGRDTEEAESLLFPTMNTVVLRSILHGGVVSWLRYMQENMVGISSSQHFPLRDALKLAGQPRGGLFNSLFIQQRAQGSTGEEEEKTPWMKSVGGDSAVEYPVCVEVEVSDEQLIWRAACSSKYLSRKETVRLIHDLDVVLRYFMGSPTADVLAFDSEGVSICGLPSLKLPDSTADNTADATDANGTEDASLWSETENVIRQVISEVSGVPISAIAKKHTVYHLGLDSISTIKVSSLLRKRGVALGVRQILGAKSITEMAAIAEGNTAVNGVETNGAASNGTTKDDSDDSIAACSRTVDLATLLSDASIAEAVVEEVLPATAMQVHMLSVWQNTAGVVFFPEFRYSLQGTIGIDTIRSAWLALVDHYPILRTTFVATGSRHVPFLQIILRHGSDLANIVISQDTLTSEIRGAVSKPLVFLHVTRVDKDHCRLKLKIHHALYDGISLPILMDTFQQLCNGAKPPAVGRAHNLWKKWLSSQVTEATQLSRRTFWGTYLAHANPPPFPRRTSSPPSSTTRTSLFHPSAISDTSPLHSLSSTSGTSTQALFLAAYAKLLANTQSNHDVIFGIYLSNRTATDSLSRLPYPTLSLVPLRVRRPASRDLSAIATDIQADLYAISSPENTSVGLWEILDWTGVRVDSFVNFLSLPDSRGTDVAADGVVLEEISGVDDVEEQTRTGVGSTPDAQRLVASNAVRDAYPDAVDIEVSLTGGVMNIGVFGPASMVDEVGAREVVSGMVDILTAACDTAAR